MSFDWEYACKQAQAWREVEAKRAQELRTALSRVQEALTEGDAERAQTIARTALHRTDRRISEARKRFAPELP